jgi:nucleotide-binding universal stress UspA family protein
MKTFKTILHPTDLSSNADASLPYAVALAKQNAGVIHLLHIFEEDPAAPLASGIVIGTTGWYYTARLEHEKKLVDLAQAHTERFGIQFIPKLVTGHPAHATVKYAEKIDADAIVISTHGRTGFSHLLLGSIAEKIIRLSAIPVLTVRPGGGIPPGGLHFHTVVVPTDFSANAAAAIPYAVGLAKRDNGKLVLAHSVEDAVYYTSAAASEGIGPDIEQWMATITADAEKRLVDQGKAITAEYGVPVETVLKRGRPFEQLDELAKEYNADLMVISTHGYTGLSHLVFGSVAEKVVRGTPCPVLSVRPEAKGE